MTRALVTGATGFVGSHLTRKLLDLGYEVIAVSRREPRGKWLREALEGAEWVRCDITNPDNVAEVFMKFKPDEVYHLAAQSNVKPSVEDPWETYKVNVMGTVHILEACRKLHVKKVYHMSSDKIWSHENARYSDPYTPVTPYATSKACADLIARNYAEQYGMDVRIGRFVNIYGFDLNPRIIPNTIRKCLKGESPIIYRNYPAKREYIYVEDAVDAIIHIMNLDEHYVKYTNLFNVGSGVVLTQEEVVKRILKFFPGIKPVYVERRKPYKTISQSVLTNLPDWKPKYSFEEGIKETIQKFREYEADWNKKI